MALAPLDARVLQNLGLRRSLDAFRDDLQRGGGEEGGQAVEPRRAALTHVAIDLLDQRAGRP